MVFPCCMGGCGGGTFSSQFRPVGSFGADVFFLHLMELGMDGSAGTLSHAAARFFRQGFLATLFLYFLKAERMLQLAFLGVKFLLQTQFFLLGDFLLRLFQLFAQDFRLMFRTGGTFLRGKS